MHQNLLPFYNSMKWRRVMRRLFFRVLFQMLTHWHEWKENHIFHFFRSICVKNGNSLCILFGLKINWTSKVLEAEIFLKIHGLSSAFVSKLWKSLFNLLKNSYFCLIFWRISFVHANSFMFFVSHNEHAAPDWEFSSITPLKIFISLRGLNSRMERKLHNKKRNDVHQRNNACPKNYTERFTYAALNAKGPSHWQILLHHWQFILYVANTNNIHLH